MSEFVKPKPLENFSAFKDENGNWNFRSDITNSVFSYDHFLVSCESESIKSIHETYVAYAHKSNASDHECFIRHWLEAAISLNAIFFAEKKRQEYLTENPKKGKQSEGIYSAAVDEFTYRFRDQ